MHVVVLANNEQREELLAQPVSAAIHFHWLAEPATRGALPSMDACIDLLFENNKERLSWLRQLPAPVVVINSVLFSLQDTGDDFIRINGWNTFLQRNIFEASGNNEALKKNAETLFEGLGRKTEWVPDMRGFVTPRVVSCIINEAFFALQEKVSTQPEIDTAMKMGTNYPYGPFEWGQKIGLHHVYTLLETLGNEQIRYKPCSLLKETILV